MNVPFICMPVSHMPESLTFLREAVGSHEVCSGTRAKKYSPIFNNSCLVTSGLSASPWNLRVGFEPWRVQVHFQGDGRSTSWPLLAAYVKTILCRPNRCVMHETRSHVSAKHTSNSVSSFVCTGQDTTDAYLCNRTESNVYKYYSSSKRRILRSELKAAYVRLLASSCLSFCLSGYPSVRV
jgi:hypothetical protein